MQGIILNTASVRDKDLIVFILSASELIKCYRFYGVRHSHLIPGYLIDFELEIKPLFLPKLHSTIQFALPFKGAAQTKAWQDFCLLLYEHLKDNPACGEFYYELCLRVMKRLATQDYKRALLDAYSLLLEYEGRLNYAEYCAECGKALDSDFMLAEGFLMCCKSCKNTVKINKFKMKDYLKNQTTALFEDDEIDLLYKVYSKKL